VNVTWLNPNKILKINTAILATEKRYLACCQGDVN